MSNNCTYLDIYGSAYGSSACSVLLSNGYTTGFGLNTSSYSGYYHISGICSLSAGTLNLAVLANGKITGLGYGDGTTSPQQYAKLTGVTGVAEGYNYALALLNDGTVTGWGQNNYGQALGGNDLTGVKKIISDGNESSIAVLNNGKVTGWGDDSFGKISLAIGLTGVVDVSMGAVHCMALFWDGTVTGWGDNYYQQSSLVETFTGVTGISAGYYSSFLVFKDSTVTGWGINEFGESTGGNSLTGVKKIVSAHQFSVALLNNNKITGWGVNGPLAGWDDFVGLASSLTGQCAPAVTYLNLNGLNYGITYSYGQENRLNTLPYSGNLSINVTEWKSGNNYSSTLSHAPSSLGSYLFYGEIIDSANYQYYGKGTGLLKINSGVFAWSGASGIFTGGNMSYIYDGNYHYFGAYNNYQVYNWFLDVEPYRLIDVNNPSAGPICYPSFVDTKTNTLVSSYPSLPPSNVGNYIQVYNCDVLKNYISGNSLPTGYIQIKQLESKIIINSFNNPYTSAPNPIGVFTYPNDIPLTITYNGSGTIPTNKGDYYVEIKPTNNNYNADIVTGIYSIVGDLQAQSYALGWGNDISRNIELPSAPTGLLGVQKLVGGNDFSIALMSDNSIVTWGTGNQYGQQNIPYINNYVRDIYASNNTTFIIDWSGNLTGCGYLFNTVGNGYNGNIPLLTGISGVSAADYYVVAVPQNLNKPITGWGDDYLVKFAFRQGFGFSGVSSVATTNLGYVCLYYGHAIAFGRVLNSGEYGQFGWDGGGSNGTIAKIACSDSCTVFLYGNKTFTGYGMLRDSDTGLYPFYIPDQSVQGQVLDIAVSSGHVLLTTSQYVAPLPPPPPDCTGITYV
jgi:alpha-tubulin suppressor-like RCC1 family protein